MKTQFRIKEAVKERGMTLSEIAKRLGIHRSNMSAIASGARGVSLKVLQKICHVLDCSLDELILSKKDFPVFDCKGESLLRRMKAENYDGMDKAWVHNVMLAQTAHYKNVHRSTS